MSHSKHKRISKFTHQSLVNLSRDELRQYYQQYIKQNIWSNHPGLLMGNFEGLKQYIDRRKVL